MLKTGIQWLMIILIATQSVWSMADAHSGHQSGLEHLEFKHEHNDAHAENANSQTDSKTLDNQADFDCHHCCHCHGAHSSFITSFYSSASIFGQSPQHSFTNQLELAQQPRTFFRPPRA
ncbi:MAG: hypothetical protein ACI8SR_000049 [Oceanicoccus sp.]|jgi:hypothetical protein